MSRAALDADQILVVATSSPAAATVAGALGTAPHRVLILGDAAAGRPSEVSIGRALSTDAERTRLLLLDSSQVSRDVAGWLVATHGAAVVWGLDRAELRDGSVVTHRQLLGGRYRMTQRVRDAGLVVALVSRVGADDSRPSRIAVERRVMPAVTPRLKLTPRPAQPREDVPLDKAGVVVCVGRGIRRPENIPIFAGLARRIGAALGATRAVVDRGWLPFSHQIGQTGAIVAPDVLLAFGVSGAPQHLAGIRASRTIAMINTDADAPLRELADVVVEADATDVARAMLDHLEQERS